MRGLDLRIHPKNRKPARNDGLPGQACSRTRLPGEDGPAMPERITRREVSRGLFALAAALAAPGAVFARRMPLRLFDFAIAGGWYHGLKDVRETLAVGETLMLRAEPENPHDRNAVAVHRGDGPMLGYVPRAANAPVARLLAAGRKIEARVVGRIAVGRGTGVPRDVAFTGVTDGDPRIRLILRG
jgi:hypothetical protein